MSASDLFGIIGSIVGIAALLFAIWTWMRAKSEREEPKKSLGEIYKIAERALLKASQSTPDRVGEALWAIEYIHTLTEKYLEDTPARTLLSLIKKRVIWSNQEIWDFESSSKNTEIWLVTPDLKPDSSEEKVGKLVHENIMEGKTYVYFYPDDLPHKESEISRLRENILSADRAHTEMISRIIALVALNRAKHERLFYRGNIILFFRDRERIFPPICLEEVVLTKISERGIFWQEHSEVIASEIKRELDVELSQRKKISDY